MSSLPTTPRTNRIALLLAVVGALTLTACGGVLTSDTPAKRYYLLQPLAGTGSPDPDGPDLGVIVTPVPGLDSDRLLALGTDAQLGGYENARWPEHLPELLSSLLARSLEAGGGFRAVEPGARVADPGWTLRLEVREFYGIRDREGQTRSVRVALAGTVRCRGESHALRASAEQGVDQQRLEAIVQAHQAGLDAATREVADAIDTACRSGSAS